MTDHPQSRQGVNKWEVGVAAAFFLVGAYMAYEGTRYGIGTITRIGPGFFPLCIGVLLMALSIGVAFEVRHSLAQPPAVPLRILAALSAGLLSFALLVNFAGLVPAAFSVIFISRFAEPGNSLRTSILLAAGLALVAWLVFILGFNLPLKAFWW